MKKITFLMLHLNYGGLEKQTITLINELAKTKKYDIDVISVYDLLNGRSFYAINKSVNVTFLSNFGPDHKKIKEAKKNKNILSLLKYLFLGIRCLWYKTYKLKSVIKDLDTDIIFSTRIEFAKLIKRKDTLNISQEHSYITTNNYIKLVKRSFDKINYIVVMTDKAKQNYISWLKGSNSYSNVIKIPNMVEDLSNLNSNLNTNQIISIGRLEEEKDINSLIEVFNLVHNKFESVKLKIVGNGTKKEELEQKVNKLGLQESIKFTGQLEENKITEELLNSSICVCTSIKESFSLVLVQAMTLGVVPISFDIDAGPKEIIDNGKNGYLIEDRNIEKMAEQIISLLSNFELLKHMSKQSKKESRKYFTSNVIQKWEEILECEDK